MSIIKTRRFIVNQSNVSAISASFATGTNLTISYVTGSCNWEPYTYLDVTYQPVDGGYTTDTEAYLLNEHQAHIHVTRLISGAIDHSVDTYFD